MGTVDNKRKRRTQQDYILGFKLQVVDAVEKGDITERIQSQEAILASDRMKSELITTAAHEFRTPLTTIQGFSELLLNGHDFSPTEQIEYLGIIHQKSLGLTEMLDNLLDLSRVEAGLPIPMTFAPCAISGWLTMLRSL